MDSQRRYSYSRSSASPPKHSVMTQHTSSAFSPSANPNEDWTKISDLAERRRIQNRIAQRNYRKKLKKRLEDLERRAGSSSASPEQRHEELDLPALLPSRHAFDAPDLLSNVTNTKSTRSRRTNSSGQPMLLHEERSMFSQQHTRQISMSPPPSAYTAYTSVETPASSQYSSSPSYSSSRNYMTPEYQAYPTYLPSLSQGFSDYFPNKTASVKQEYYGEDEMNPFSMSYASMAGVDIPYSKECREPMLLHTPPLSDYYGNSVSGSPPTFSQSLYTSVGASGMMTPPLTSFER